MTSRVVIHQDDVGMCHGANVAFVELSRRGTITCGSAMVPCPWFSEIAELARRDPTLDLGVHLTLTAEKEHYRWRPLTAPVPSAGLADPSGNMWRDVASVRRYADPDAVEAELVAQVEAAIGAGIVVTHLDAHMGATLAPELAEIYLRLGSEHQLPVLLTGSMAAYGPSDHLAGGTEDDYAPIVEAARSLGQPIFDEVRETPWDRLVTDPALPTYEALFSDLSDGLTFMALHPNTPGELESIEPDTAHIRTQQYDLFRTDSWAAWLKAQDFEPIGMRGLASEGWRAKRSRRDGSGRDLSHG